MTSALRLPTLTIYFALLAHVVECRDSSIIRSHEVKAEIGKHDADTAAVSINSQGGLEHGEEEHHEADDTEDMGGELDEDDELEAGDEENEHEAGQDGEDGEELEDNGAEEIRYLPEKNLLALEELQKKIKAGEDVPKKSIVSLLDDENFQRLDPSTKMIPIRVGFDGDAAELTQTGQEGEMSELAALIDHVGVSVFVQKILDGRNVTSEDAKPMTLSELMETDHEPHQGSSFAEEGQEGEQDEDDGVRYLPKSRLDELEQMYKEGKDIGKDDLMMLISDDDFATLADTEVMVPVQLEGEAAQIHTADELGPLIDKMGSKQFFENLMKGKDVHGHPSMTLAELKEDPEHEEKDKDGASLLEEGEEDAEHEEGEEAGEEEEEGQEGDEEDHDSEDHAGDEDEGHDEGDEDGAAGDDEHEDGEKSFEEEEAAGKPDESTTQDDGDTSSDSTAASEDTSDGSAAADGTQAEAKATM